MIFLSVYSFFFFPILIEIHNFSITNLTLLGNPFLSLFLKIVWIFGSWEILKTLHFADLMSTITVDGVSIPFSKSIESLGVLLTPSLDWSDQITSFSVWMTSTYFRRIFVSTLIVPYLDYCCLLMLHLWRKDVEVLNSERNILHLCSNHLAKWPKVDKRRNSLLAIFLYKQLNSDCCFVKTLCVTTIYLQWRVLGAVTPFVFREPKLISTTVPLLSTVPGFGTVSLKQ